MTLLSANQNAYIFRANDNLSLMRKRLRYIIVTAESCLQRYILQDLNKY